MPVRVAIIGAGVAGHDHARTLSEDVPGACVHLVCDPERSDAERLARHCDAETVEADPIKAMAHSDVDAVVLASPSADQAILALAAIDVKKPVLFEPPFAVTTEECLRIIRAEAEAEKRFVQIAFNRRFDPSYVEMKAALISGRIGPAAMMHNRHRCVASQKEDNGLHPLLGHALHDFDVVRFVLEQEIDHVTAVAARALGARNTAPVLVTMETQQGQVVTVEINCNAGYGFDVRSELIGTTGAISLSSPSSVRMEASLMSSSSYDADERPRFAEALRLQDKAWIRSIVQGTPAPHAASVWDGYCAQSLAEAALEAVETRGRVQIALGVRPEVYG